MEDTLETKIVLKKNSIEVAGKVGDSTVCTEYEEGKMSSFVPECDSFKKCQDLGNIASFPEDHDVSEISDSSVTADAISSLHLPRHPIDCKTNVQVDQQKVQDEVIDPLVPGLARIVDSVAETEHLEVDQRTDELKSVVTHSFALVFPELDAFEALANKESADYDTLKKYQDVRNTTSFADASQSLYLPRNFGGNKNIVLVDQHKAQDNSIDPLVPGPTRLVRSVAVSEHLEVDQIADELKSAVAQSSFALVFSQLDALETPANKDNSEYDTHKKHPEVNQMADELKSVGTHSFALVFPELDALETPANTEITEYDTLKKHPKVNQMADELKSIVPHSFALFPELAALETPTNKESTEYDTHKKHPEVDQMADKIISVVTHYSLPVMLQKLNSFETLTHKEGILYETCMKHKDVGNATSCAGNLELTEINQSSVIADADSDLCLPVHLIDNNTIVHINQHTAQHTSIEPLHYTDILNSLAVENHPKEDNMFKEVESSVIHDSFASVQQEPDTLETLVLKDGTDITSCQNHDDNYGDNIATNDPHIVKVNEGHKEFIVQNVDEAELVPNDETVNFTGKRTPGCDGCNLFSSVSNILLDNKSPGTEINNQDTIGPLENPAFLRTLHYSLR